MSAIEPGPIQCPSCSREVARDRWFVGRRIRPFSCPHCGSQFELVIPAWPHYVTAFAIGLLVELFAIVTVMLLLGGIWWAALLVIAIFLGIELLRSAWLRGKSQIRWINQESMQRQAGGAWVPK